MNQHLWPFLRNWFSLAVIAAAPTQSYAALTSPAQPVEGEPWSIVLSISSAGLSDDNPAPPTVRVVDNELLVRVNAECISPSCDVLQTVFVRVDMPGLAAGDYVIRIEDHPFASSIPVTVSAGSAPPRLRPADGFWMPAGRPGSGIHIQLRGETVGLGIFDSAKLFSAEPRYDPLWSTDATPLRGNALVSTPRRLATQYEYDRAINCLTCVSAIHPQLHLSRMPFQMTFESERRAWFEDEEGNRFPMVAFAFGDPYLEVVLEDTVDVDFGTLPMPNLQGTWAIASANGTELIRIGPAAVMDGQVVFADDTLRIECLGATADKRAGCQIVDGPQHLVGAFAPLGNIHPSRIRFEHGSSVPVATKVAGAE